MIVKRQQIDVHYCLHGNGNASSGNAIANNLLDTAPYKNRLSVLILAILTPQTVCS
ncbi:hypothetical protein CFT9_14248 [Pseudomonas sp. CFT9]|nr:hypothetical protein CFT9_14248 [Pseudomonas sp. CFT9]